MKAPWTRWLLCALIGPSSLAQASDLPGVAVDPSSIDQRIDASSRTLAVTGRVANALPLPVDDVAVRLYVPGPDTVAAKIWEVSVDRLESGRSARFAFEVDLRAIAGQQTFVVRVWRYHLATAEAREAMALAQAGDIPLLRSVVETLARQTGARPALVAESLAAAPPLGRLCLAEAVLRHGRPEAVHLLLESSRNPWGDRELLAEVAAWAQALWEPSPLPAFESWRPAGELRADARSLVETFPAIAVPALVRMRHAGSPEGRRVADGLLREAGIGSFPQQWERSGREGRGRLVAVYRELGTRRPDDRQFPRALAEADLRDHALFISLALATSLVVPVLSGLRRRGGER